jgi:hypothetical protein
MGSERQLGCLINQGTTDAGGLEDFGRSCCGSQRV